MTDTEIKTPAVKQAVQIGITVYPKDIAPVLVKDSSYYITKNIKGKYVTTFYNQSGDSLQEFKDPGFQHDWCDDAKLRYLDNMIDPATKDYIKVAKISQKVHWGDTMKGVRFYDKNDNIVHVIIHALQTDMTKEQICTYLRKMENYNFLTRSRVDYEYIENNNVLMIPDSSCIIL